MFFDYCVNLLFIICLALQLDCFKNGCCHSCYNKNVPSIMFLLLPWVSLHTMVSSLTGLEKAFWWTKPHPPPRSHKVVSWKAFRAEGGFLNAFPGLKLQKNWQMLAAADNFNSDDGSTVYRDTLLLRLGSLPSLDEMIYPLGWPGCQRSMFSLPTLDHSEWQIYRKVGKVEWKYFLCFS